MYEHINDITEITLEIHRSVSILTFRWNLLECSLLCVWKLKTPSTFRQHSDETHNVCFCFNAGPLWISMKPYYLLSALRFTEFSSKTGHWNSIEIPMKFPCKPTFSQRWNSIEIPLTIHCFLSIEIPLKFHWNSIEIPLKFHWTSIEIPLKVHWNSIEVPLKFQPQCKQQQQQANHNGRNK